MIREIVKIDEELCDGCGECVPNCHEGALQIIDDKARLISDLMCDGLGACLGHCPQGAITIEKREAEPYDELKVMELMVEKGENTVIAHLKHLKDHKETVFLEEGIGYLQENALKFDFDVQKVLAEVEAHGAHQCQQGHGHENGGGCPGSAEQSFGQVNSGGSEMVSSQSQLRQWPVQMHLINPRAGYFQNADVVIAADCVAFALGDFHQKWLKGKSLAIACPKLDQGQESYAPKIKSLIEDAQVNTITVMIMQVPCCHGLVHMVYRVAQQAERKVPVKMVVVGIEGEILQEGWLGGDE